MTKIAIVKTDQKSLEYAAEALNGGALVVFPTDTFFALGVNVFNVKAVESVFNVKGRDFNNPLPVLINDLADASSLYESFSGLSLKLARVFWPGPLTIIDRGKEEIPDSITAGTGRVGVRVPQHNIARKLIRLAGIPITGTSANPSGIPPSKNIKEVIDYLGSEVNIAIDGECGTSEISSTVVDTRAQIPSIKREGDISLKMIQEACRGAVT
mgnify:CR=1 FL=1